MSLTTKLVIYKPLVMFNRDRFTVIHLKTLALQCNIMVIMFFPKKSVNIGVITNINIYIYSLKKKLSSRHFHGSSNSKFLPSPLWNPRIRPKNKDLCQSNQTKRNQILSHHGSWAKSTVVWGPVVWGILELPPKYITIPLKKGMLLY